MVVVVVVVDLGRDGAGACFWSFVGVEGVVVVVLILCMGFLERERWREWFGVLLDFVAWGMRVRCVMGDRVFVGWALGGSSVRRKGIMRDRSTLVAFRGDGEVLDGGVVGDLGHVVIGSLLSHVRSHADFATSVSSFVDWRVAERSFAVLYKPGFYYSSGSAAPCVPMAALLFFLRRVFLFLSGVFVRIVL